MVGGAPVASAFCGWLVRLAETSTPHPTPTTAPKTLATNKLNVAGAECLTLNVCGAEMLAASKKYYLFLLPSPLGVQPLTVLFSPGLSLNHDCASVGLRLNLALG